MKRYRGKAHGYKPWYPNRRKDAPEERRNLARLAQLNERLHQMKPWGKSDIEDMMKDAAAVAGVAYETMLNATLAAIQAQWPHVTGPSYNEVAYLFLALYGDPKPIVTENGTTARQWVWTPEEYKPS